MPSASAPSLLSAAAAKADRGWSGTSETYLHFSRFTDGFARQAVKRMVSEAQRTGRLPDHGTEPIRCLDIAAGNGVGAFAMIEELSRVIPSRSVHVTATDVASGMLAQLQRSDWYKNELPKYPNARLDAAQADMCDMSMIDTGSVDIATMIFGLMFPPDPVAALKELRRVLKPGGVAVVLTWHSLSTLDMMKEILVAQGFAKSLEDVRLPVDTFGQESFIRRVMLRAGLTQSDQYGVRFMHRRGERIALEFVVHSALTNPAVARRDRKVDPLAIPEQLARFVVGTDPAGRRVVEAAGTALCICVGFDTDAAVSPPAAAVNGQQPRSRL